MPQGPIRPPLRDAVRRLCGVLPAPVRHVAGLARGTALAQLVMLLAIPLLARLYGPLGFGVFGVFSTACAGLGVAAAARFEQGIIPAARQRDAVALVHLSLAVIVAACIFLAALLLAAWPVLDALVTSAPMRAALWWVPVGVAAQAAGMVLLQWATRLHRDVAIARFYAERALIMSGTQVALGVAGADQLGLVFGQIAGLAVAGTLLAVRVRGLALTGGLRQAIAEARLVARGNRELPRFGLPRMLVEAAANIALPILVAALFGAAAMGATWMALRILSLPSAVVGEPIKQVFFRRATERHRSGAALVPMTLRTIAAVSLITVPFAALLLVGSQTIFDVVLGPSWALAAVFVKIMAVGWVAAFVAGLYPALVILLGLQKQHFLFEIALRTAEAAAILIGFLAGSILIALAIRSAVSIAYVLYVLWFIHRTEVTRGTGRVLQLGAPAPEGAAP